MKLFHLLRKNQQLFYILVDVFSIGFIVYSLNSIITVFPYSIIKTYTGIIFITSSFYVNKGVMVFFKKYIINSVLPILDIKNNKLAFVPEDLYKIASFLFLILVLNLNPFAESNSLLKNSLFELCILFSMIGILIHFFFYGRNIFRKKMDEIFKFYESSSKYGVQLELFTNQKHSH